jgi:hypothetical protein
VDVASLFATKVLVAKSVEPDKGPPAGLAAGAVRCLGEVAALKLGCSFRPEALAQNLQTTLCLVVFVGFPTSTSTNNLSTYALTPQRNGRRIHGGSPGNATVQSHSYLPTNAALTPGAASRF